MPILREDKKIIIDSARQVYTRPREDDKTQEHEDSSKKFIKGKIDGHNKDEEYLKLTELVDNSKIIYHTKAVFPFDFFPDELIIDKDKVAVIFKYFFASTRQQSILVKNISDVYADVSVLFATLKITDKYFADSSMKIEYLKKEDAVRARDIIQGLMICHDREVDIAGMNSENIMPYLEEIGKATAN